MTNKRIINALHDNITQIELLIKMLNDAEDTLIANRLREIRNNLHDHRYQLMLNEIDTEYKECREETSEDY